MATKARVKEKVKAQSQADIPAGESFFGSSPPPCVTLADHVASIQALGRKVEEHIRFVATVETLPGTSRESRERAVIAFHERLATLERALGQTLEDLRLG